MGLVLDTPYRTNKTKHYPGEVLGVHTLIGPRGNPEHGNAMAWDYRCGVCGATCVIESHIITNLRERKGCRHCCRTHKKTTGTLEIGDSK